MRVTLTNRESDVMTVLWDRGASTVAEVQQQLNVKLAYTTVLTILRTMESKGYVTREAEGKAHRYKSCVSYEAARRSALRNISERFFKGSTDMLLLHLVENESLTDAQIRKIKSLLADRKKRGRK